MSSRKNKPPVSLRDRILETVWLPASSLLSHPMNYRIHSQLQSKLVGQSLNTVGWVRHVIVNRTTGLIVDGHLRVALAITAGKTVKVPVDYVELSESEELSALAVLDESAGYVFVDEEKRLHLLTSLEDAKGIGSDVIGFLKGVILERSKMFEPLFPDIGSIDNKKNISQQSAWKDVPMHIPYMLMYDEKQKAFFYEVLDIARAHYRLSSVGETLLHLMRLWNTEYEKKHPHS